MDERGSVNRARGELERRRQEAYRARAAATVKIQRWYRQQRADRTRSSMNGGDRSLKSELDSLKLPAEESCAESASATLSTISQRESQGTNHTVSDDIESASDSDENLLYNRNAWASSSQLQERSSSFDEFVNSEVAVAQAMVDDSYMENLNNTQRKRVERLKAYQKSSHNPAGVPEISQTESLPLSAGDFPPSNSSGVSQVAVEKQEPNGGEEVTTGEVLSSIAVEDTLGPIPNTNKEVIAGEQKSLIPVRNNKLPLSDQHKRRSKNEPVNLKKAETKTKPQVTTKLGPAMQNMPMKLGATKHRVEIRPTNGSIQKPSKPTSNQNEQWKMKEQHVQKQRQTKEYRQIEQPGALEIFNCAIDDTAELPPATKDLAKITDKSEMASVNDTNDDVSSEHTQQAHTTPSSSTEGGAQASLQSCGTHTKVHTWTHRKENKQVRKVQQTGCKILKFASNVMCQSSNSTVHDPSTEHSEIRPRSMVKQSPHPLTAAKDQCQQHEELPPLKKSSATTRLMLETEHEVQSDSVPLLKQRHKTIEKIHIGSSSFLDQGLHSHNSKLKKRLTEARRQRMIKAAPAHTDDSDSDGSSSEHLIHADIHSRAKGGSYLGSKFIPQGGGGYGAAYAKRRETNRKRIIRSLKTPQCKPTDKKQPAGYLQKFLRSSVVQNYIEDLAENSAPPSYSSSKGKSWHTAWTSMGGLPRPGRFDLPTSPGHSPPPQEWMSVMNHASSISLFEGRRRPHRLHPLDALLGNKQFTTSKPRHRKSYTYHYNQQLRRQALAQYHHSQQLSLSTHWRSLSHVMPISWRRELYYEPNMTQNRYRGAF